MDLSTPAPGSNQGFISPDLNKDPPRAATTFSRTACWALPPPLLPSSQRRHAPPPPLAAPPRRPIPAAPSGLGQHDRQPRPGATTSRDASDAVPRQDAAQRHPVFFGEVAQARWRIVAAAALCASGGDAAVGSGGVSGRISRQLGEGSPVQSRADRHPMNPDLARDGQTSIDLARDGVTVMPRRRGRPRWASSSRRDGWDVRCAERRRPSAIPRRSSKVISSRRTSWTVVTLFVLRINKPFGDALDIRVRESFDTFERRRRRRTR